MANARILIAEDEAIVALDIKQTLERQGYAVSAVVSSAAEAIQECAETRPDLVLMDIALQGELSGVDAAHQISTHFRIPVIYLTAHGDEATAQEAKITQPLGYILKPLKDRELELTVEMALQRHAMELSLREREQWLAATLGTISDAVITTDKDGDVTYMNRRAEDLTGWHQNEALGRDWKEVLTLADAHTRTPIELSLAEAVERSSPGGLRDRVVVARDGTPTIVDGSITSIRDETGAALRGFVLCFRDIGERRRTERALRESEARWRTRFGEMPIGMYQTTPDGRILDGNPALVRMLGYASLEELKQRDLASEGHASGHPRSDFKERIKEEGQIIGYESRWTRKDGSKILVRENARAVHGSDGQILYYEGTAEDITEHRRTQEKLERRVAQLALLSDMGERIAATLELDAILDRSARLVQESFGYHHVALFILDPEQDALVLKAGAGDFAEVLVPGYRQKLSQGIVGWVARNGETLLVNDVEAEPRYVNLDPDAMPTRSELAVPIRIRGEVAGVLDVQSPQLNAFDAGDVTVMETVADQIALALSRAQLYETAQRRSERLAVLNAVSSAVFASLEPETVMQKILAVTRQAFEAPEGAVLLRDSDTGGLVFAVTSSAGQGSHLALEGVRLEPGQGIAGWVVEHDRSVLVDDVHVDPRWYRGVDDISGFQTRSLMSAPLKRGGEIIGAVEIVGNRKAAFTSEDLGLLEALCSISAVGLDNARLYAAMRSHADRLALLHHLGQALSATLEYDAVIHSALSQILDLFPADGIWFFEPEPGTDGFRLVAGLPDRNAVGVSTRPQSGEGLAAWSLELDRPVLVQDALADPRFSDRVDRQLGVQTRAMMAVPLVTTDRVMGAIAMSSREPQAFDRGDLNMLQAIASTMSVALQNARLYENLRTLLREREASEARLIQSEKMAALGRLIAT
ncbi:MAG: GAF domain-containing protein, partial [Anaerolineae bacterium]